MAESASTDLRVLTCNYRDGTSAIAAGAKAYVLMTSPYLDSAPRVKVLARSRSGRWIEKIESLPHLRDVRWTTVPAEHPQFAALMDGGAAQVGEEDFEKIKKFGVA